jgi:hypothetical protein
MNDEAIVDYALVQGLKTRVPIENLTIPGENSSIAGDINTSRRRHMSVRKESLGLRDSIEKASRYVHDGPERSWR